MLIREKSVYTNETKLCRHKNLQEIAISCHLKDCKAVQKKPNPKEEAIPFSKEESKLSRALSNSSINFINMHKFR